MDFTPKFNNKTYPILFRDLAKHIPEYEFVICQDKQLTKEQYHTLLGEAKMVFSANTQETLGISCYEGALVGANPMVPDRLSYSEMFQGEFLYPSEWTEDFESYKLNKDLVMAHIRKVLGENDKKLIDLQAHSLTDNFFSGKALYEVIRGNDNGN